MLCYTFLFFTFLMNAVNIRGSTTPPVPELLTTQNTPESTTTSAQCQRPTLPDNMILKSDSYKKTYEKGFTAKLECAVGYKPANYTRRTIVCLGDRWTDVGFQCIKKTCGSLRDIPNGRYLYTNGIEFGAKVKAECDTGYQLYGSDTRICEHNGWSGRDIECEVVKCIELPSIKNGEPEDPQEPYEFGQSVTYKCKKDFDMIGESTLTCSKDGDFQPSPPECLNISCGKPDIPYATRVEGRAPYKLNSAVRYECDRGYKMTGSGSLVCQKDGWVPSLPNCTVVTCLKPSDVDNGYPNPNKERYEYGETVTYSCRKGFKLEGASKITCSQDETFKPSPPRCVVVTCLKPPAIRNGKFNDPPLKLYNYGQAVTYSCMEGFRLEGASRISCSENGHFLPSPPLCVGTCPTPPAIDNGQFGPLQERYDYGQAVTYSCIKEFRLKGASTISCSEDGTFHPPPPQCVATCPTPPAIDYGQFGPLLEFYEYGQAVTYSCIVGFRLKGASTVFCSKNGTFHPPPPQCGIHWIPICIIAGTPTLIGMVAVIRCLWNQKKSQSYSMSTFSMEPLSNKSP